jgi:secreted Zn-dependent insulinase-like peptidase
VFNFFKRQYSANLMTVCLIHNASLQKLEEIALEKLSLIPNKNVPQTIWQQQVFRRDQMGLKLFIVPVRWVGAPGRVIIISY